MRKGPVAQGRRVRLVLRRIEPLTVLRFSVLLYMTMYLVILVAGLVLWAAATATGLRHNIEKFIGDLIASDSFHLLGGTVAKASVAGGAVMVVIGTGANVLMAVLYNLISDVIGGVILVFEERPSRRRRAAFDRAEAPARPVSPGRRQARETTRRSGVAPPPLNGPLPPQPEQVEPVELTRPAD